MQELIKKYQSKGFVIENGKVLCASPVKVKNLTLMDNLKFMLGAFTMVTMDQARQLKTVKDEQGNPYLKFAWIPAKRIPQFNEALAHPDEIIEEADLTSTDFLDKKKKVRTRPELPPASTFGDGDDEDENTGDEDEFDKVFKTQSEDDSTDDSNDEEETGEDDSIEDEEESGETTSDASDIERKELMALTRDELADQAKEFGIEVKVSWSKSQIVDKILE